MSKQETDVSFDVALNRVHFTLRPDDNRWYWQDSLCEEPMGPFDFYCEAWRDYKACRGVNDNG